LIAKGVFGMSEIVAVAGKSVKLFKGHYTSCAPKIDFGAPNVASPGGVTGMDHILLTVSDISRSVHFYRDVMGMRVEYRMLHFAMLRAGNLADVKYISPPATIRLPHRPVLLQALDFFCLSSFLLLLSWRLRRKAARSCHATKFAQAAVHIVGGKVARPAAGSSDDSFATGPVHTVGGCSSRVIAPCVVVRRGAQVMAPRGARCRPILPHRPCSLGRTSW
jgi:Glyoxalase/Bleomycin resistance protein/Dioxygenase superfamily